MSKIDARRAAFRDLHRSGCFVIPNPWDAGTTRYLQRLGFKALATTSSGFSFSRALPDMDWAVPRDMVLGHIAEIVAATGWQPHTVRGAFAGALKKRLGLAIASEKVEGRGRVYRIDA